MYCSDSTFICKNGGTCQNITVSQDAILGFQCNCQAGYSGFLCESSKKFK